MRIDGAADDPQPPARIEPALDGLDDAVRLGGEEVGLEAGRQFEGGQFGGGIVAVGGNRAEYDQQRSEMTNECEMTNDE